MRRTSPPFDWRAGRLAAVAAGALCVLTVVVGSGLGRAWQENESALAGVIWPWNAAALAGDAGNRIAESPEDAATARRSAGLAQRALALDASQALAYAVLGMSMDMNHGVTARRLVSVSDRLSRRILLARLWLIEDAVSRGDVDAALRHYDIALRTSRQASDALFPILVNAAGDPNVAAKLAALLRTRPQWRDAFLINLAANANPVVAWRLLKAGVGPGVPDAARSALTQRLAEGGQPRLAFALAGETRAEDGVDLAQTPERFAPFTWTMITTDDTEVVRDTGDSIAADTRATAAQVAISRMSALASGRYTVEAKGEVQSDSGRGSAKWTATCVGGKSLATLPLAAGRGAFTVPPGCPFQWLRLEMTAEANDDPLRITVTSFRVKAAPQANGG